MAGRPLTSALAVNRRVPRLAVTPGAPQPTHIAAPRRKWGLLPEPRRAQTGRTRSDILTRGLPVPHSPADSPDLLPILGRGKHRNPRKGACFMELASFLAGERWSDHPRCTHPLLAELARLANDHTSDLHRSDLATLIPSVIGLTSDDIRVDARVALRCARTALPVVSEDRQRVMAVSVLTADRVLADLEGRGPDDLEEESLWALAQAPHAAQWAHRFAGGVGISPKGFRRHSAPNTVRCAVQGIGEACVADTDAVLRDLLAAAIRDVAVIHNRTAGEVEAAAWATACELSRGR